MSRVLLAVEDIEYALDVLAALEQKGHKVEHVFDLAEALLRAQITKPHALVADLAAPRIDHALLRRWNEDVDVPLIVTSTSAAGERVARRIGAAHFLRPVYRAKRGVRAVRSALPATERPGEPKATRRGRSTTRPPAPALSERPAAMSVLVDIVETSIAKTAAKRYLDDRYGARKRSGTVEAASSVLLAARGPNAREIISAFVRSQLGLRCVTAATAADALAALQGRITAVLLECDLLVSQGGGELLKALDELSLPIVPLRVDPTDETAAVGRAAWDAIPSLRAALKKRAAAGTRGAR